jgi:hypothetical protein
LSGDIPSNMAAHAVRDGPNCVIIDRCERILVDGTDEADLASADTGPPAHREYAG